MNITSIVAETRLDAPAAAPKPRLMLTHKGRGKELADMLRAELGVPARVKWFEVRFALDEVITVRCEYMPTELAARDEP